VVTLDGQKCQSGQQSRITSVLVSSNTCRSYSSHLLIPDDDGGAVVVVVVNEVFEHVIDTSS